MHAPRVTSVRLPTNLGKNAAIHTGSEHTNDSIVVLFDADLTIDPEYIQKAVVHFRNDLRTFVFGARTRGLAVGAMPPVRRLGNWFFAAWVSLLVGHRVADALCGLKVLPRSVLLATELSGCRWGDLDLVFAAADHGLRFVALPIEYRPRPSGVSKMKLPLAGITFALICLRRSVETVRRSLQGGTPGIRP
jgi:glycosyltransferase involved in cell wall biosynthesis